MGLQQTTRTQCPCEDSELRDWLRIDSLDFEVSALGVAATEYAQNVNGRRFLSTEFQYTTRLDPTNLFIRLPAYPLREVSKVEYLDAAGAYQTLAATDYRVSTGIEPGYVVIINPPTTLERDDAIRITFKAGFGDYPRDVPERYKLAIRLLVAEWYRNREASAAGALSEQPIGVSRLLLSDRVQMF